SICSRVSRVVRGFSSGVGFSCAMALTPRWVLLPRRPRFHGDFNEGAKALSPKPNTYAFAEEPQAR
ncbi:MAG: hypothetical protein ACI8S6_005403, partial [Myxococcota bacterium]